MKIILIVGSALLIASCASDKASQRLYTDREVGQAISIKACTVVSSRQVIIKDQYSGDKGEKLGFIAGRIGTHNDGALNGFIGGLIGGAVGRQVSDKLHERDGVEYTVLLANGDEKQLVQDIDENEVILKTGDPCRLQVDGSNNRVLSAKSYPNAVKRPQKTGFSNDN